MEVDIRIAVLNSVIAALKTRIKINNETGKSTNMFDSLLEIELLKLEAEFNALTLIKKARIENSRPLSRV